MENSRHCGVEQGGVSTHIRTNVTGNWRSRDGMITKGQAAEHQLDTAIRLFFENIDHLSSYTLAAASREITDDLCEKKAHALFQQGLHGWEMA
jgi:hypothetical protein